MFSFAGLSASAVLTVGSFVDTSTVDAEDEEPSVYLFAPATFMLDVGTLITEIGLPSESLRFLSIVDFPMIVPR